ncbi:DUF255 domain-containing protein [Pedobacter africanus]|uniref:Thioredoxin domain-containing protein n=1 Tax=Pedobacter africanus TaxID=151894 RepID=A0A1W1Z7I6_9SPHI|nr:DUF255 domain-containing protein [Pedobacter africanus]SMC44101.1 Protein of unknown function, DUF255 [Pedobacter africanus]
MKLIMKNPGIGQAMLCLLLLPVIVSATKPKLTMKEGIQWTTGLSWTQVKEKAKKENKYIFLDVFATWCGPCKEMDKTVYVNDSVGNFINAAFIAVKVQTDQTKADNPEVQKWYDDAKEINKAYRVLSLPTFIFLSPDGKVVHKTIGYRTPQAFIAEAVAALKPGQAYVDPYIEFDELEADYKKGKKDYSKILYMMRSAKELGKEAFEKLLIQDYLQYLEKASDKKLYTKANMEFLNAVELKSDAKLFAIFYPDGKKADKAAGSPGFADRMVNRVVFREIISPFLKLSNVATPVYLNGVAAPTDKAEADWPGLYQKILQKYPKPYAERGLLNAKLAWYEQHYNYPNYYNTYLQKLDKYGIDTLSSIGLAIYSDINMNCWQLFERITDKALLAKAAKWMHEVIKRTPLDPSHIDTYANLLYKAGEKDKAMVWEEKALRLAEKYKYQTDIENFKEVLTKMRTGEKTWP